MESTEFWKSRLNDLHRDSYGWSLVCCGNDPESARDVLQTVYLKIYEGKANFKGQSDFKTWLFSVIKYTSIDFGKSLKSGFSGSLASLDSDPGHREEEMHMEKEDQRRWFKRILEKLSGQQQEVLLLAFYQDMTLEQIAAIMDLSVGTVRTHYERGKENFRKLLMKNKLISE